MTTSWTNNALYQCMIRNEDLQNQITTFIEQSHADLNDNTRQTSSLSRPATPTILRGDPIGQPQGSSRLSASLSHSGSWSAPSEASSSHATADFDHLEPLSAPFAESLPGPSQELQPLSVADKNEPEVRYASRGITTWLRVTTAKSAQANFIRTDINVSGSTITAYGSQHCRSQSERERDPQTASFHHVFPTSATTDDVARGLQPLVERLIDGQNAYPCIFVDGYSGSGKSTTINSLIRKIAHQLFLHPEALISRRICLAVAKHYKDTACKLVYYDRNAGHRLTGAAALGPRTSETIQYLMTEEQQVLNLVDQVTKSKFCQSRSTENNDKSSRGWLVYIFTVKTSSGKPSCLYIVDQPGNERSVRDLPSSSLLPFTSSHIVEATKEAARQRQLETNFINFNRLELGKSLKDYQERHIVQTNRTQVNSFHSETHQYADTVRLRSSLSPHSTHKMTTSSCFITPVCTNPIYPWCNPCSKHRNSCRQVFSAKIIHRGRYRNPQVAS